MRRAQVSVLRPDGRERRALDRVHAERRGLRVRDRRDPKRRQPNRFPPNQRRRRPCPSSPCSSSSSAAAAAAAAIAVAADAVAAATIAAAAAGVAGAAVLVQVGGFRRHASVRGVRERGPTRRGRVPGRWDGDRRAARSLAAARDPARAGPVRVEERPRAPLRRELRGRHAGVVQQVRRRRGRLRQRVRAARQR